MSTPKRLIALSLLGIVSSGMIGCAYSPPEGITSLEDALRSGDVKAAKYFINTGADVNSGGFGSVPPLFLAVESGNEDLVSLLLSRDANPDIPFEAWTPMLSSPAGPTPIMFAAALGRASIVQLLVDAGANVRRMRVTMFTFSPLQFALNSDQEGAVETVRVLLDAGARISDIWDSDRKKSDCEVIKYLQESPSPGRVLQVFLDHGLDANCFVKEEKSASKLEITALGLAIAMGSEELVEVLLAAGANSEQVYFEEGPRGNRTLGAKEYAEGVGKPELAKKFLGPAALSDTLDPEEFPRPAEKLKESPEDSLDVVEGGDAEYASEVLPAEEDEPPADARVTSRLAEVPTASALRDVELLLRRLGPIEWGMSVEEAQKVLGERISGDKDAFGNPLCYYVYAESVPEGVGFMVEEERIVRVDIDVPGISTRSGISVGDSETELLSTYPQRLNKTENKYAESISDYIYVPQDTEDKEYRLLFEVENGTIIHMRAGILPAVLYVEHCL